MAGDAHRAHPGDESRLWPGTARSAQSLGVNILFLSQVLPYPLDAGPKVRSYYVLRHLGKRHAVTLATFVRNSDAPAAQSHLRTQVSRLVPCPIKRSVV